MSPERWQQIERLYHDALDLPADERPGFLANACQDDEQLRREVKKLLAANDQATGFLSEPAFAHEARNLAALNAATLLEPVSLNNFSHYQILSPLGAGGMGEVFLARDTKLERRVAIKILPARFTADADRLQRFAREAKSASALNHPNIITIHEIGEAGDVHFIATEFIEGQTLRRILSGARLRVTEVLPLAIQVASALDAAHKAGIVHRDIKPENIMVRPDGLVKVLDFGLAKLLPTEADAATDAQTQMQTGATMPGTILGTLRYMSPEQARGQAVDARTDIFSLGAVLYELLTGQMLFAGETSADVIGAILHQSPPPLSQSVSDLTPELERIVNKALAKDRELRYQTARDLQTDLQTLKQELEFEAQLVRSGKSGGRYVSGSLAGQPPTRRRWPIMLTGMLAVVLLALVAWKFLRPPSASLTISPQRLTTLFSERITSGGSISRVEFSPSDGKLVTFSINKETGSTIWLKQLSGGEAKPITDGKWRDRNPIWSQDGQQIAFLSDRGGMPGIWAMPYLGGDIPHQLVAFDIANCTLIRWSTDGQTIFFERGANLFGVQLSSGTSTQITQFGVKNTSAQQFRISPDEKTIAYSDKVAGQLHILTIPMQGGTPRQVTFGEGSDVWPAWYPDGRRFVFSSNRAGRRQLYLGDLDGRTPQPLLVTEDNYHSPTVSPTGAQVVCVGERENANIYGCELRTGKETGYTTELGIQLYPELSPNGQRIAFQASNASLNLDETISLQPVNQTTKPLSLVSPGFNATWSPAGSALAFLQVTDLKSRLLKISAEGGKPVLLASSVLIAGQTGIPFYRMYSSYEWSPDARTLAYISTENGVANLWQVSSDGGATTQLTTNTDAKTQVTSPHWSPNGQKIAYLAGPMPYMAPKPGIRKQLCVFAAGQSTVTFETEAPVRLIGWSATGKELFLALGEQGATRPQKVTLLKIGVEKQTAVTFKQFNAAYLHSAVLSADKQQLALVTREDGRDNIVVVSTSNGSAKQVSNNSDTTAYYSGLTWAPDRTQLFYSRQSSGVLVSLIENAN